MSTSCNDISSPGACTQRGCGLGNETGLAITLIGDLPSRYAIRLPEHSVLIECTAASPCDRVILVPDITPSRVFVEFIADSFDFEGEFVPDYFLTFPNGPECGECRHGAITIDLD
jgi:hypothetical protein